jgi:hypothetical protein
LFRGRLIELLLKKIAETTKATTLRPWHDKKLQDCTEAQNKKGNEKRGNLGARGAGSQNLADSSHPAQTVILSK